MPIDRADDDYIDELEQDLEVDIGMASTDPGTPEKSLFDEEDIAVLNEIKAKRKELLNELSKPGKLIPESTGEKIMLMQLIDGMEKQVFTKTRLKISSKIEEKSNNLAAMVASVLLQTKIERPEVGRPRDLKLDADLKHSNPVPGMGDIGVIPVRYEDVKPKRD